MFPWLSANYLEILGVVFSLLYLLFSIRRNILLWPMGIISASLYMLVFFRSKFYADMGLNAYYLIISVYGWIVWHRSEESSGNGLRVTRIGRNLAIRLILITAGSFVVIGLILSNFTDSPIPYWDAFTTALSFTATWMLARKILEHWIVWVVVDGVSMGLYLYRGLYPTLVLFSIYTAMAVVGYIEWRKAYQQEASESHA